LSKPFVDLRRVPVALLGGVVTLLLAACGSSAPRQAAVEQRAAVTPAPETSPRTALARPEPPSTESGRRERRSERRAEDVPPGAAAADVSAPIPETAVAAHDRALAAMRAGNWLEAELELEQLTASHAEFPGPHVNLAIVYLHDGRRADARGALERALALDAGHAAANTQLGILLREEGEFAAAEGAYRRALATDPAHSLAHYNLGVLLDVYLRRAAEALEHYEVYQSTLAEPNETVGRWIIDLRRRVGSGSAARVAQEDRP
jgi:tetratricopeptide (TPR) repeat protein